MRVGALIEARSASTRLPGKCFLNVWTHGCLRKQMINVVYDRVKMAQGLDDVAVVCPGDDRALIAHCRKWKMNVEPGPLEAKGNVMLEDLHCARRRGWDVVVQITGDCPCIDPLVIETEVQAQNHMGYDFVANLSIKGSEARIVRKAALEEAAKLIHGFQRDGTTIFYLDFPEWRKSIVPWDSRYPDLSVDTPEDLNRVRSVLEVTGWDAPLKTILEMWDISVPAIGSTSSPTQEATTAEASPLPSD